MKTFYHLLANVLIVATTTNFVWFAITFWVYLETKSVVSTGIVGGMYLVATALSGFWLGSFVDHYKKKTVLLVASSITLLLFLLGFLLYIITPLQNFTFVASPILWLLVFILMAGVLGASVFTIAIPTLVTILVPQDRHDKANGMFGTVMGFSFAITSIASGFVLAFGGMLWVLILALVFTVLGIIHLLFIPITENHIVHTREKKRHLDIKGTIAAVSAIPGLFPLIFFNCFNNFLGGVFMALMDAYGLSLVPVHIWGTLLGSLSFSFILGGLFIAKKGLGTNPLKTLFLANIVMWIVCIFFTIQASIVLLIIGMIVWMSLVPFIEATEQTIIQKVVPHQRQGRVFGFAQSVEQAASPLTAFLIGPITQFIFIPFMTTGAGVDLIGEWFGIGPGRGIALVFITTGIIGLIVTLFAFRSRYYFLLSARYAIPTEKKIS